MSEMIGIIVAAAIVGWGLWFLAACILRRRRHKVGEACLGAVLGMILAAVLQDQSFSSGIAWPSPHIARVHPASCSDSALPLVECSLTLQAVRGSEADEFTLDCGRVHVVDDQGNQLNPLSQAGREDSATGNIVCSPIRLHLSEVPVVVRLSFARDAETRAISLIEFKLRDSKGRLHSVRVTDISLLG